MSISEKELILSANNITIAENMQKIYEAIEAAKSNGGRQKTGTFSFSGNNNGMPTFEHNCGFVPSVFIVYPIDDYTSLGNMILGCVMYNISNLSSIEATATPNSILEQAGTTLTWRQPLTNAGVLTENTAQLGYRTGTVLWKADFQYGWIAFEFGEEEQNPFEYAKTISETYKGVAFPDGYELTLNLPNVTSLNSAFYSATGIKKITIKGNENGNSVNFYQAFRGCLAETIDLTRFTAKFSSMYMAFYYNTMLVEILGEIDLTECTNTTNAFTSSSNLVTFTPKANTIKISISFAQCSKLSTASVQSIFDGLATVDTAQTLTLHKDLKILQSQVDSANAKGWTVAGGKVVSEEEYYG